MNFIQFRPFIRFGSGWLQGRSISSHSSATSSLSTHNLIKLTIGETVAAIFFSCCQSVEMVRVKLGSSHTKIAKLMIEIWIIDGRVNDAFGLSLRKFLHKKSRRRRTRWGRRSSSSRRRNISQSWKEKFIGRLVWPVASYITVIDGSLFISAALTRKKPSAVARNRKKPQETRWNRVNPSASRRWTQVKSVKPGETAGKPNKP